MELESVGMLGVACTILALGRGRAMQEGVVEVSDTVAGYEHQLTAHSAGYEQVEAWPSVSTRLEAKVICSLGRNKAAAIECTGASPCRSSLPKVGELCGTETG